MRNNYLDQLENLKLNFHKNKIIKNLWRLYKSPLKFAITLFTKFFGIRKEVVSKSFYGINFFLSMYDYDSFGIYVCGILNGYNEYKTIKFLLKNLKDDDVFYDVGASYGFYTFLAAMLGCETHAFEPNPYVFSFLKKTQVNNLNKFKKRVFLNNMGLGEQDDIKSFYFNIDHTGGASIFESKGDLDKKKLKKINAPITSLDKYINNDHTAPSFIKINTEGYTPFVLKGGGVVIKKHKPILIIEMLSKDFDLSNYSIDCLNMLNNWGYSSYVIDDKGDLNPITTEDIINGIENGDGDNYIFKIK